VIVVNFTGHPTTIPSSVLKFSADYVGAMKNEVTRRTGAATLFMQGAAGDQSVVADGPRTGYEAFGTALGDQVVKLASSLEPKEIANPSLLVKEDRFRFNSRIDLSNPMVLGAYQKAFFPEMESGPD
jgi:neutral ceramidase